MKNHLFLILFASSIFTICSFSQNIAINTTGVAADASALLEVGKGTSGSPDTKGLLMPRVNLISAADASTISSPAPTLLVYNFGTAGLSPAGYYYNSGTAASPNWVSLLTSSTGASCCSGWTLKAAINSTIAA